MRTCRGTRLAIHLVEGAQDAVCSDPTVESSSTSPLRHARSRPRDIPRRPRAWEKGLSACPCHQNRKKPLPEKPGFELEKCAGDPGLHGAIDGSGAPSAPKGTPAELIAPCHRSPRRPCRSCGDCGGVDLLLPWPSWPPLRLQPRF